MRLFLAFHLNSNLLQELQRMQAELQRKFASGISYPPAERLHLTIKFLGEIDAQLMEALSLTIQEVTRHHPPFQLKLTNCGCFPSNSTRRNQAVRILWAGIEESEMGNSPGLKALVRSLDQALRPFGIEPEDREFSAHITLARVKSEQAWEPLRKTVESMKLQPLSQRVEYLSLVHSQLSSSGPLYSTLQEYSFGEK